MPLGAALACAGATPLRSGATAAGVSLGTELLQFLVPGRDPVASDVLINAIGALIGWGPSAIWVSTGGAGATARRVRRWLVVMRRPDAATASRLSLGWAVMVALVLAVTGWLLTPWLPFPYYYLVASPIIDAPGGPVRVGLGGFEGLIDEVRMYERALTEAEILADLARPVASSGPGLVAAEGFEASGAPGWTPDGRFGGALRVDEPSRRGVALAGGDDGPRRAMTLEGWVRPGGSLQGLATVVTDGAVSLLASSPLGTLVPMADVRFGMAPRLTLPRRRLAPGEWTHLATTYDGQVIRLYVDGHAAASVRHWSPHEPVSSSLDGVALESGAVPGPEDVRARLLGDFALRVGLRCGPADEEPAPAFLLVGVQSIEVLALDVAGTELQVRSSTRAGRLGLRAPPLRVPGALSACRAGEIASFTLRGPLQDPRLEDAAGHRIDGVRSGVGAAWAVLFDSRLLPASLVPVVSLVFLAALLLPFGYWARPAAPSLAGAALVAGSVLLGPLATGAPAAGAGEAGALAAGGVIGVALARLVALRSRAVPARS